MISPRRLAELLELPAPAATAPFSAVVIDSREAQPGSLFVALRGERTDGHRYVDDAVSRGATGLLVSQPVEAAAGVDVFSVDDTLAALQRAAAAWRNQMAATVVGITGSVGKTTVREATSQLLGQLLGAQRRTYQSPRNFNGDIGLPIALLGLGPEHEWAVLELGPYSQAEMELLVCTARADVGIVTNVGPTHLERFGTLDDTERIKGLLPASLPSDGLAILNADDPRVLNMARRTSAEVLTFGRSADADLRASDVEALGFDGLHFELHHRGRSTTVHTPLVGEHQVMTVLAAAAVGLRAGLSLDQIAAGASLLTQGSRLVRRFAQNGATVIDDAYNAAPLSMRAALDLLAVQAPRRVAVLGDMLELGSEEADAHLEIGAYAASRCDRLLTVGPRAVAIGVAARAAGLAEVTTHMDAADAAETLLAELRGSDSVLVKASHAIQLERLVEAVLGAPA